MREWIAYLGEIILITAVSGLLYTIAPEGNLKKHLQFVISLCIVVSLAVPMFSTVMNLPELFENGFHAAENGGVEMDEEWKNSLIAESKKGVEKGIVSYIAEKYAIEDDDISVETILNTENPESILIQEIQIIIKEEYPISLEKIRTDLYEMFLGKSKIIVSFAK